MQEVSSFANHFLIAMPTMADPNFSKAVTYICEHNKDGAFGIIINRPLEMELSHILGQMNIESDLEDVNSMPVIFGGPVQQERGFIIHRPGGSWRSTFHSHNDITVTTSQDILHAMAKGEGPADALVALGCAGWSANQLEEELQANAWLISPASPDIIFKLPFGERWRAAAKLIGVDIDRLASVAGHS